MASPFRALAASLALLTGFAAAGPASAEASAPAADLVVHHAIIRTVNDEAPVAQAVAISAGRIVAVGSDDDIAPWIGAGTKVIDGTGLAVYPGFIESHGHLMLLGRQAKAFDPGNWWNQFAAWLSGGSGSPPYLDLSTATSYDEIV